MPVTLVKGKELVTPKEDFAPGIVQKEWITFPTSENLSIGYYKALPGTPDLKVDMPFEEVDYVIKGTATFSDETGNKYTVKKGDVIYISKGSKITISHSRKVGFEGLYVITPYNWRELMKRKES
jgi:ethanolamine utilization protein EutQ (cupin superfamily)